MSRPKPQGSKSTRRDETPMNHFSWSLKPLTVCMNLVLGLNLNLPIKQSILYKILIPSLIGFSILLGNLFINGPCGFFTMTNAKNTLILDHYDESPFALIAKEPFALLNLVEDAIRIVSFVALPLIHIVFGANVLMTRNWKDLWCALQRIQQEMNLDEEFHRKCRRHCIFYVLGMQLLDFLVFYWSYKTQEDYVDLTCEVSCHEVTMCKPIGVQFGGRICNSKSGFERTQYNFGYFHKIMISIHQMPLIAALLSRLSEIGVRTTFIVLTTTISLLFDELGERVKNFTEILAQPMDSTFQSKKNSHQIYELKFHYDLICLLTEHVGRCFGIVLLVINTTDVVDSIVLIQNIRLCRKNPQYYIKFLHVVLRNLLILAATHRAQSNASTFNEALRGMNSLSIWDAQLEVNTILIQISELSTPKITAMDIFHLELFRVLTLIDNAFQWGVVLSVAFTMASNNAYEIRRKPYEHLKGDGLNDCPNGDDYSPCHCHKFFLLSCSLIPLSSVAMVFENKLERNTVQINTFALLLPPMEGFVPSNLLFHHQAIRFSVRCEKLGTQEIRIDEQAFTSSRNVAEWLHLGSCDVSKLNLFFLKGFHRLKVLYIESCSNVHMTDWASLPALASLGNLIIARSTGLDDWVSFPVLSRGLMSLHLQENNIGDEALNRVLQWLLNSPSSTTLEFLVVDKNSLTQIPKGISSFKNLGGFRTSSNPLKIIRSGSLAFKSPAREMFLGSCDIHTIESGAFQGNFGNAKIDLSNNRISRFESSVFQDLLLSKKTATVSPGPYYNHENETYEWIIGLGSTASVPPDNIMKDVVLVPHAKAKAIGALDLRLNPFDCSYDICHLAWIIRDQRHLLEFLVEPKCYNGTLFVDLDPEGFQHC